MAFLLVLTSVLSAAQAEAGQFKIKVSVDLVNVNFSAMDSKGRLIPGLTAKDFAVEDDGELRALGSNLVGVPVAAGLGHHGSEFSVRKGRGQR